MRVLIVISCLLIGLFVASGARAKEAGQAGPPVAHPDCYATMLSKDRDSVHCTKVGSQPGGGPVQPCWDNLQIQETTVCSKMGGTRKTTCVRDALATYNTCLSKYGQHP